MLKLTLSFLIASFEYQKTAPVLPKQEHWMMICVVCFLCGSNCTHTSVIREFLQVMSACSSVLHLCRRRACTLKGCSVTSKVVGLCPLSLLFPNHYFRL